MRIFSTIFIAAIILVGITFAILNSSPVILNYYFGTQKISLSLLLALTLGIGVVCGLILFIPTFFKLKKRNYKLKHQVKQMEKELLLDSH